jgi:peptidoglycan/xylan/chitin deacetylase (PgdA/CDA1 family)
MRFISPILKHVLYPGLSRAGYFRGRENSAPTVVTYHGILPPGYSVVHPALDGHLVSIGAFKTQLELLRSKYHLISLPEFLQWIDGRLNLPPHSVLLTCDDGLLNTLTEMLPVIQTMQVPFLFFVTGASAGDVRSMLWYEALFLWLWECRRINIQALATGATYITEDFSRDLSIWRRLIKDLSGFDSEAREQILQDLRTQLGISKSWESSYSHNEALRRRFLMMNAVEIREVAAAGVSIGAHTVSHPMLSQMTEPAAYRELSDSRSKLETALGRPVLSLAYPFGDAVSVTPREPELARRAGFQCAFRNTEHNGAEGRESRFAYPRVHVSFETSPAELEAHICGFHRALTGSARFSAALIGH